MEKEFSQSFFLSAGETDAEQELSLPVLTSKIIDIATAHANSLGIGNPSMADYGCGWVLSRLAIEMDSYPTVNETYIITTWIENWNRHFSERCFRVSSPDGRVFGYARSIWMVLDTHTHENAGLSRLNLDQALIIADACPIAKQGKHTSVMPVDFDGTLPRGAVKATIAPDVYTFKYTDLDYYRHVNTVRYVNLLLNRFSLEQMDATRVRRMELAFLREGRYGETVKIRRSDHDLETFLAIEESSDSTILCARFVRTPR